MRISFVVLTFILLAILASPGRPGEPPERKRAGSASCEECHPDLHASWRRTAHSRTFLPAGPGNLPREAREDGTAIHAPGRSTFSTRDGAHFVTTLGDDGREREFPLVDVVGVRRIRMYLTRLPNGRRQVLPAMLDQTQEEWFDYTHLIFGVPGADPAVPPKVRPGEPTFWTGMTRFFDARCARCHTTGFEFRVPSGGRGDWGVWEERGIGCEACHGGGADHVAHWSDGDAADPMPGRTERKRHRAVSVCYRCHMEGEIVKPGFRPGDDWFEYFDPTLLDDVERVDAAGRPLELIYDGAPFAASRCANEGKLTCTTCHDPHGGPYRSQLRVPPRDPALCAGCHKDVIEVGRDHTRHDPDGVGSTCTGCHMPPLTIERGHGIVTDHTIGVPNPEFPGERVARDACTTCHSGGRGAPGGVPELSRERLRKAWREWWPAAGVRPPHSVPIAAARSGDASSVSGLAALAANESAPPIFRASAAKLLGRFPERALPHLSKLIGSEDSLVRRAAADALGSIRGPEADSMLLKAVFDESAAVRSRAARAALRGWARVRRNRRLLEAVIDVLAESAAAVPEDDGRWFLLGAAHQIAGDLPNAVIAYERKLQLDPYASLVRKTVKELKTRLGVGEVEGK